MISKQQKGVSPVIGVILMVAITVIIAAVVANFVLNLGSNLEQQADATVTFSQEVDDFGSNTYVVTVSVSRMDNADYLIVKERSNNGSVSATHSGPTPSDVEKAPNSPLDSQSLASSASPSDGAVLVSSGDVATVSDLAPGAVVQVFGGLKGKENQINTYEVENTLG